jgi:hypothetical protein
LGRYYLYFADHGGDFIRLAYADHLAGPWRIYAPGTLRLEQTVCSYHVASPDVRVDETNQEIRMYFHGPHAEAGAQLTFLASSRDGIRFSARSEALGPFYFRVFMHDGWHYAVAKHLNQDGLLLRSQDGVTAFEEGPHFLPGMRHVALRKAGNLLQLFYTRIGDVPERILLSQMRLEGDWQDWRPGEPTAVLEPELDFEGVDLPLFPSRPGPIHEPARQLRDPAIFEQNGQVYLLYAVAGERGIAIAQVVDI